VLLQCAEQRHEGTQINPWLGIPALDPAALHNPFLMPCPPATCTMRSQGWDKTYCLRYIKDDFQTIHFFGDKTFEVRGTAACMPPSKHVPGMLCDITQPHDCLFPSLLVFICLCMQGGNDYEIFSSDLTQGHTVTSPEDTRAQCTALFMS
jgi:hypothetical protein